MAFVGIGAIRILYLIALIVFLRLQLVVLSCSCVVDRLHRAGVQRDIARFIARIACCRELGIAIHDHLGGCIGPQERNLASECLFRPHLGSNCQQIPCLVDIFQAVLDTLFDPGKRLVRVLIGGINLGQCRQFDIVRGQLRHRAAVATSSTGSATDGDGGLCVLAQ